VPAGWEHLCPDGWTLSDVQRAGIAGVASGRDVLVVAATGSGKSLIFLLPAIARWAEAIKLGEALPPVALLVVPYIGLAESQLASTERLVHSLCEAGRLPRRPRALFVRRTLPGTDDDYTAQPCSNTPATGTVAIGGGCQPDWAPRCLPCKVCVGCRDSLNDVQKRSLKAYMFDGRICVWNCRVSAPPGSDDMCAACKRSCKAAEPLTWCRQCSLRKTLVAELQAHDRGDVAERSAIVQTRMTRVSALPSVWRLGQSAGCHRR